MNKKFLQKLDTYKANENAKEYNKAVLRHYLKIDTVDVDKKIAELQAEIKRNKERISAARKKVLNGLFGMMKILKKQSDSSRK